MRKQTKLAVVLAAAALVAVGSASLVSAAGWVQEGSEWRYQDASGDYVTDTMKKSGDTTFYLDENGYMAKDYFTQYNENYYYFGSNGAMVRNTWVAIDPSLVDNADEDVDAYWFYFQDTGKAFKGGDSDVKKKKIDGKTYFFDSDGKMLTGWFDATGEKFNVDDEVDFVQSTDTVYYAGEDGVARAGWLAWSNGFAESVTVGNSDISDRTTVYFYFNTTNFKATKDKEKTINGKKYRFDPYGVMYTGWEYDEDNQSTLEKSEFKYYSGEDDGHMVKKGWVYAVPSEIVDSEKNYDDESAYFYFNSNGMMQTSAQKRINGKYYIFSNKGIMKTGLIVLNKSNEYVGKIDLEYTDGADFIKRTYFQTDDPNKTDYDRGDMKYIFPPYLVNASTGLEDGNALHINAQYTIHYFGSDGAKVTGNKIAIEFADDIYNFASKNNGGFTGEKKKKFYSNGFLLQASDDIKLGLALFDDANARRNVSEDTVSGNFTGFGEYTDGKTAYEAGKHINFFDSTYYTRTNDITAIVEYTDTKEPTTTDQNACRVLTTAGAEKKKGAYKDADGNYWLVNKNKVCVGIYDVQVKFVNNNLPQWKGSIAPNTDWAQGGQKKSSGNDGKDDVYIDFNFEDKLGQTQNDHLVTINNDYCLNFTVDNTHYAEYAKRDVD